MRTLLSVSMAEYEHPSFAESALQALQSVEMLDPDISFRIQDGNICVYGLYANVFNVTHIDIGSQSVDLGRVIAHVSPEPHGLDTSCLVAIGKDELYVFAIPSDYEGIIENWEDPRHIIVSDRALIGVTAVLENRGQDGEILFSPGFIWARFEDGYLVAKSVRVFEQYNGEHLQARGIVPLEVLPDGSIRFIARLDREDHFHTLSYYVAHPDGTVTLEHELQIPVTSWGSYKYGTAGGPIPWGDNGQQLLFLHGQERRKLADGCVRTHYAKGAIVLDKEGNILQITQDPLITRSMIPFTPELRDENAALYIVDTPRASDADYLEMRVSAGDITTVSLRIAKTYIRSRLVSVKGREVA